MNRYPPRIVACFLLLAITGCGGKTAIAPPPTARPHHHAKATPTAGALPTTTVAVPTVTASPAATPKPSPAIRATATPRPQATHVASVSKPSLVSVAMQPASVAAGAALTASATTHGDVGRVVLYLSTGPGGAPPITYSLSESSPGSWSASGAAPTQPGTYRYAVGLFDRAGNRTILDADSWLVTVNGGAGSGSGGSTSAVKSLPDNVPLSPPFSYGNPVAAVFSAEGKTINGSEVSSDVRTDVGGSYVAQYYEVHFPRAGWVVDSSTVPPAGAPGAFSIVATSGKQVCVAEYVSSSVRVFYGTLPG